jgi:predicted AAA+ superfamily ATPase
MVGIMYIHRELTKTFRKALKQFPSVLITGPRQSGKSTFVQHLMAETPYLTFDDPLNRDFAAKDPNGFLDRLSGKTVILDEIQYVPSLFQYLKIRIDRDRRPGIWIMTGSQQFTLMKNISETLAGRIAILELAPFSLSEIQAEEKGLEEILWVGLYPEPSCFPDKRHLWIKSYVQTYLERDVRQLENIRDYRAFEMFANLCAAYHSQEFHPAGLARDCGVSQPTIKAWSKILEAGYITFLLPPFFKNFGKRIIKTPKLYFSDPALVSFLTRQPSPEATFRGTMGGAFFEGLIVSEAWKAFLHSGQRPSMYFWRSQSGLEVDIILQVQGKLWPIEIKRTSTPTLKHTEFLDRFKSLAGKEAAEEGVLVCTVDQKRHLPGGIVALPWSQFPGWLRKRIV